MAECLFCRIVRKEIPAKIVYESEKSMAFRDIHPRAPVHVLVIPKEHIPSIYDVTAAQGPSILDVHATIQKVADAEGLAQSGFRVVVNNGPDAGQEVAHLHYHVLGGRRMPWPPG